MHLLRATAMTCSLALAGVFLPAQQPGSPPKLSVDARLVALPVVVRDKKGALVQNLAQADFALSIDGAPAAIRYFDHDSNLPLTLGLLVDTSMSQRDVLDDERSASTTFLDQILRDPNAPALATRATSPTPAGPETHPVATDQDRVFVLQFAHQAELLQDLTASRSRLEAALREIDTTPQRNASDPNDPNDPGSPNSSGGHTQGRRHGGGTVLYDALFLSADEILKSQHGRKAIVVLTDGVDNGSRESLSRALESLQRSDVVVYAIYFKGSEPSRAQGFPGGGGGRRGGGFPGGGGGGWPGGGGGGWPGSSGGGGSRGGGMPHRDVDGKKILEQITGETGGRTFEVSHKQSVADIYKQIAEELRSQYRLGFTPTAAAAAEGYHQIDLTLPKDKSDRIQTRDGYYSGASSKLAE